MDNHWTDDELIAFVYGVDARGDGHVERCAACAARLERIEARRHDLRTEPEVPSELLFAQRRAIQARLEEARRSSMLQAVAFVPSLAAVLLLLVGLMVFGPSPATIAPKPTPEAQLFEEVFTLAADPAPQAVEPVQSLFEVQQ